MNHPEMGITLPMDMHPGGDEGLKSSQENGKGISSTIKKEVVLKWT